MPAKRKHGRSCSGDATYAAWCAMRSRCLNDSHESYPNYGGRGISICERWMEFANFLADMGDRPQGMEIDRINNDGNYEPGNCRWATKKQQMQNRRTVINITIDGETLCIAEWARRMGVLHSGIRMRLVRGMNPTEAVMRPFRAHHRKAKVECV